MYILGIGILSFLYMIYKFNNVEKNNLKNLSDKNIENVLIQQKRNLNDKNLWSDRINLVNNNISCEILQLQIHKKLINNILKKQLIQNNYKNIWNENIKKVNRDIIQYETKDNFAKTLKQIETTYHYCRWVYDNNINELIKNKLIILDFKAIFNYDSNEFISQKYVENLSKFCHKHGIIFVIISELHPSKIPVFKFINKNNVVSPYHYKSKAFGGIVRLNNNKINDKAPEISINKIINDIFNRYGSNYENSFYIGINIIPKLNCLILDLKTN